MLHKLLVEKILEQAHAFEWSLQGLGLLRLYFGKAGRLHIWDKRFMHQDASEIHDHSWDLESTIVCGKMINVRYLEVPRSAGASFERGRIVAGYNARLLGSERVYLAPTVPEVYTAGMSYSQRAHEIHRTNAEPGTVTLVLRDQGDPDAQVHVFWPSGTAWGSAIPRPATYEEVEVITKNALSVLRKELA